ncbi:MAG: FeoB-associated Cys-rich membrane protein [Erysipelotrichaceae bacterium]|nr:FeoB-associated Cys-rich membrane protein [Erysipelotrichaceae bacterium]
MSKADIIVMAAVLAVLAIALYLTFNNHRKCGSCAGCPYAQGCTKIKTK